ncbi:LytTR family DNA-binding domain-containing protein [Hathewaya histolytica]|uniref:LytR family transcriptional regulator n=1 Tax=Hathewaya histolytica TaxID=1498 RepID=A0A4V6KEX2_HATHI|nr:LytTR family DNA-binding domain-containing protein [Hathewaya histolytica]VTQ96057.1 LytR family transcriptional regulator [Hathewaya histolytica]
MKIKILLDKLINREDLVIKTHPDNSEFVENLKDYLERDSKITVINAKNNRKIKVDIHSILVFQSEGNMCCLKMKTGELYLINKRLKELESLGYRHFIKINNQTIINMNEIQEFSGATNARLEVIMSDKTSYFVNRHYVKLIKERLL